MKIDINMSRVLILFLIILYTSNFVTRKNYYSKYKTGLIGVLIYLLLISMMTYIKL